jgi:hypothetical protein
MVDHNKHLFGRMGLNKFTKILIVVKDNSKDANGTITPDTSTLTVQILDANGNVVATQTTSADTGVVSTSHTF